MSTLQSIQDLYDRHLFLRAYHQSAAYWTPATDLQSLSVAELVLGGRLAARLGGLRLARRLFMAANSRAPGNPAVRYFGMHFRRRGGHLFDTLREFEEHPDLDVDDPELRASWFGSQAVVWASVQDFQRAYDCIQRARSLGVEHAWILTCESEILGLEDRWEDALNVAERAWEKDCGAPHAARCLGHSLIQLGRAVESAQRLSVSAQAGESFEIARLACWHLCAAAETLKGEERDSTLVRARSLADRLPALAPLADRETRSLCACIELDIAEQSNDRDGMQRWAEEIRSPFYRLMLENLRKNPGGRRILLPFQRVTQKHDTCLPTSLSAVLSALGIDVSADEIAREITYGGTAFWAAADWLEKRGLAVRFFIVTPDAATRLLQSSIPFVLGLEWESSAHAVAVVGLDEAASTLLIHDPNSYRTRAHLLDYIQEEEGPIGPKGMVVVPPEQVGLVDEVISAEDSEVMAAYQRHQREREMGGPAAARRVVSELVDRHPLHVVTRYLQSIQMLEDGRAGEALTRLQELLNEHPHCLRIREGVLWACHALGNTALVRETLEGVVERGMLPGVQSGEDWRYPPIPHVCQYADLLRMSALLRQKAHRLLRSVLQRQYAHAEAWHVLGDLLWHDHDEQGMLLSYRIASCLQDTNEHHAQAYSDALRHAGREQEGLAWLQTRVRRLGASPRAVGPWMSWISALEEYGYPEQALAACDEALQSHGGSSELLAFAVPFLGRMGMWDRSEAGLRRLEGNDHQSLYQMAAVNFLRMRGSVEAAIGMCRAWVSDSPRSMSARRQYLDLLACRDGQRAAVQQAADWVGRFPGHDQLEELHYQWLGAVNAHEEQNQLLVRRVKRNNHDGWAWRELAYRRLAEYERLDDERREELKPLILKLLAQCNRTAPDETATLHVNNLWLEARGLWVQAVEAWLKIIDREPDDFLGYRRAWECSAGLSHADRRRVFDRMEGALLRCTEPLSFAHDLVLLVAGRFGLTAAEEAIARWRNARPDDPDVIQAEANLLLEFGHGRTDAERALALLETAVQRFPHHTGLRFGLAHASRSMGRSGDAESALEEIVRRHPDNSSAMNQLAWIHERRGEGEEARLLLDSAASVALLDPEIRYSRARFLIRHERFSEASSLIREGLDRLPESVQWREMSIDLLLDCGDEEGAVETARQGVQIHPRGAYMWYLLANTLNRARRFAAPGEVESCVRTALSFNVGLYEAADGLAMLLVEQRRYDDAEEILKRTLPRLADPSHARGRLAWILHERGRKGDALEEMTTVLETMPWYRWGWDCLMDWLVEDEQWGEARRLLAETPPQMRTHTRFRRRRLITLAAAGFPTDRLDTEWDELLRDFPEDVDLHLERFDQLRENQRYPESASVLKSVESVVPDSPFMLARLVEVFAEEDRREEAMDTLLRIWFAEVEESTWPATHAWTVARKEKFDEAAYQRARRRLVEGARPTLHALRIMADHAMRAETGGQGDPQKGWRAWFPGAGAREILALLDLVDRTPWVDGRYRAVLFRYLCDFGYYRPVIKYWQRRPAEAEADPESWAQVGMALSAIKRRRAKTFLGAWRQRAGIGMWVIANYVLCFNRRRKKDRLEILASCRDALAILPHDHAAKGLAHLLAEMCALLGDTEAFREAWTRYGVYYTGEVEEGEWLEKEHAHLLREIPRLGRLLDRNDMEAFRKACRQLGKQQHDSAPFLPDLRIQPGSAALRAVIVVFMCAVLRILLALAGGK